MHDNSETQKQQVSRPKRKAANAHIFRYLQTRDPSRLEENDLKRALEASLEEHPDAWPEADSASCSSSDQSGNSVEGSSLGANASAKRRLPKSIRNQKLNSSYQRCRNHQNHRHCNSNHDTNNHIHPSSHQTSLAVHSRSCPHRYNPVRRRHDTDFFHDGIMEYIAYELSLKEIKSPRPAPWWMGSGEPPSDDVTLERRMKH